MRKIILGILVLGLTLNIFLLTIFKPKSVAPKDLKTFTLEELKQYNGTDPSLPIYLAYNGDVYDITAGREFYKMGGVYHDLAGKDSTKELNFAGGGIIKVKYKIIGRLR